MNRQGVGTQALRSTSGNNFFASQPIPSRDPSMASTRLPNGKIAATPTGWGSGLPMSGQQPAPGFSNPPSRQGTIPNFAQAIGGGIASRNLDMSEFPSLSGGPQPQGSSQVSQAWNGNALRQVQPLQQTIAQRATPNEQIRRPQQQQAAFGAFGQGVEDTFDSQVQAQVRSVDPNPTQPRSGDDFPPLGGIGNGNIGMPQGAVSANRAFAAQSNGQADADAFDAAVEGLRSPQDTHAAPNNPSSMTQQLPFRNANVASRLPPQSAAPTTQQLSEFTSQPPDSPVSTHQTTRPRRRMSDMPDHERYGLQGLVAQLSGREQMVGGLVMGQDLSTLGIDFDTTEPLFPTFSTPFADGNARPAVPDFALPAAYSVGNVPALGLRIGNFSDETLFAIFYQYTRDVMQELAAAELYSRDWRWHKELRQWMMKDSSMAQPVRITERSERGVYVFFDAMNWRRERREFILNYDDLDQRHASAQQFQAQ